MSFLRLLTHYENIIDRDIDVLIGKCIRLPFSETDKRLVYTSFYKIVNASVRKYIKDQLKDFLRKII